MSAPIIHIGEDTYFHQSRYFELRRLLRDMISVFDEKHVGNCVCVTCLSKGVLSRIDIDINNNSFSSEEFKKLKEENEKLRHDLSNLDKLLELRKLLKEYV